MQIQDSDGSGIDLGSSTFSGGLVIDSAALASMTGGNLLLETTGNIGVGAVTQPAGITGQVQLDATGATSQIRFDSGASSFFALTANAANGIEVQQTVVATSGGITVDADADASGAGTFSIAAAGSLTTSNQAIQVTAHDVDLQNTIDAGTANVTITSAAGAAIGLGTAIETLNLSGSELSQVTAGNLVLATGDSIRADGLVAADSANAAAVTLNAGQQIQFEATGNVLSSLVANADDGVAISGNLTTSVGSLAVDGDSNNAVDSTDGITFADGVQLQAASGLSLDATSGQLTANGSLDLLAADGINLNDSLTGTVGVGVLTINADSDANDQDGTFTLDALATIDTNDRAFNLTANDLVIDGSIDTGTAQLEVIDSDGDGIGLGSATLSNGARLSGTELQRVTSTDVVFQSSGAIEVDQVTATNSNNLLGTTTLTSGTTVSFAANGATFNALSVSADEGVDVNGDVTSDVGSISMDGDANTADDVGDDAIQFADGVQVQAATGMTLKSATGGLSSVGLTLRAAEGITLEHALSASGALTLNADTTTSSSGVLELFSGATLSTNDQAVDITADDLVLGASIDSGAANTTITESDGDGIGLGDATIGTGLNLSGAELLTFVAGDLELVSAGPIEINQGVQSTSVTGSTIVRSGGTVSFLTQASTFGGLQVEADDGIDLDASVTTTLGDLLLDGDANGTANTLDNIDIAALVSLNSAGSLSLSAATNGIGSVADLVLDANDGVAVLSQLTAGGTLTVNADNDSGDGVGTFSIASGASVISTGMAIGVTANDIDWQGSIGDATTSLTLTDSDDDGIGLGVAPAAGGIEITGSELQSLAAASLSLNTGARMSVGGITAANSNSVTGLLTLNAAEITFDTGTSVFNSLDAQGNEGITVNGNITTDTGALSLDGDANSADDAGLDSIVFSSGVQVQAATELTLSAQTGLLSSAGSTFVAAEGIRINHAMTATGAVTFDADATVSSTGALTLASGADLTATDLAINITADDLILGGNVNSGTATTTITESDGDGVGLGDASVATGLNLSGTELLSFTAGDLELISGGGIVVNNGVQSTSVTGTTVLRSNATVSFATQASTFAALTVEADDGVDIDVNVTTSQGNLVLNGDADGATDTLDSVHIAASVTLTSAGSMSLASSTGGISSDADLDLIANDGVSIEDDLSAGGTLSVNADNDSGDGVGTFAIASGATVTSVGMSIDVTADQIDWQGSIGDAATALSLTDSDGDGIGLGVSPGVGGIEITGGELQNLTATNLTLTTSGNMAVEGITAANSNNISGVVELVANEITFNASASTFNALSARSNEGIAVNGNLTTDLGDLSLDGDDNGTDDAGPDSIVFASGTQLQAAGAITLSADSGSMSGDALTLRAADNILVNHSLTLTGALTADADTDAGDEVGRFEIASGESISAASFDVTANDVVLSGTLVSASDLVIRDSDASGVGLGDTSLVNGIHLTNTELQQLTSNNLTLETSGNLIVDNVAQPASVTGTVSLRATGAASTVSISNNAASFGTLSIDASDGFNVDANLTTSGGLAVVADSDAGDETGAFRIAVGVTVNATNQTVSITANDVELSGSLNAGTGAVSLIDSDGTGIGLGDAAVVNGLNLTGAEFQQISAGSLALQTTGSISVENLSATNTNLISGVTTLSAGGSIGFSLSATFNELTASANDGISVAGSLATDSGNLSLDGDANDTNESNDQLFFAATATVTSAGALTLGATGGGIQSPGALTLEAADGITIEDSLTTSGDLTLNADTDAGDDDGLLSVLSGAVVSTGGGALDITTNDFNNSGSFDSGGATTTIRDSDGDGIGLGDATVTDGINLANADLTSFSAGGLTLVTAGGIVVDGYSQSATISGTTTLTSSQSVSFSGTSSSFNQLAVDATNQISVGTDVSTTIGGFSFATTSDVQFDAGVQLTSAGSMTLDADTNMQGLGSLTLRATAGLVLNDSLTVDGTLTVNSDSDGDGAGTLEVAAGATLSTNNQSMTLTVGDLDIFGAASSGTASTTIEDSDGAGIGLGDAVIVGGLNLSVTDLQDFTAGGLILNTSGNIEVDNMSQPATLSGTTELNAGGAGSTVSFENNASSFNTLSVNATDGVSVQANLSTTVGALTINADSDAGDNVGTLTVGTGVVVSTANQTLQVTANDISLSGSLDSGSAATVIEDSDGDGIGLGDTNVANGLNLSSAGMLNVTANGLTLRSSDLIVVDNVTQPNSITGTTLLVSGDSISFVNNASVFTSLDAQADDQISVSVDVSTSSGDLILDGDANTTADTSDTVAFAAGVQVTSAGSLELRSSSGGMSGGGALGLSAADGIRVQDSLAVSGVLTVNADSDAGDGVGDFEVAAGATVGSSNQSISVTANTLTIDGALDAGTAAIALADSDGSGIGVGDAAVTGGLNLTNAASTNLSGANVTLTTAGNLTVENFTQGASVTGAYGFEATGSGSFITFENAASSFSQLNLTASDGVAVSADLTVSTGGLTVIADNDAGDNLGTFAISSGVTVDTNNQAANITANDVDLLGSLNAGTSQITVTDSDGSGIRIGETGIGTLNVGQSELQAMTGNGVEFVTSGTIVVNGVDVSLTSIATAALTATQSVTFSTNASQFNALSVNADDGVAINANVTTTMGDLSLNADSNSTVDGTDSLTFAAAVSINSAGALNLDAQSGGLVGVGSLTLNAADGVNVNDSLTTSGTLTIDADTDPGDANGTLFLDATASITSGNQSISITANELNAGGTIDAGTASITLIDSDGTGIGLGGSTVAGGLNVSNADFTQLTSTGIQITTAGNITASSVVQPGTVSGTTSLSAGGSISFVSGSSSFAALDVQAADGVVLNVDVLTTSGDLQIDGDSNDTADTGDQVQIASSVQLTSAGTLALDSTTGGISALGPLGLNAANGVTISAGLTSNGALTVDADTDASDQNGTFTVAASASIDTGNNAIQITADDVDFLGTVQTGSGSTAIVDSDGSGVSLADTGATGRLHLTGSELQNLTTTGLTVSTSGEIVVSNISATNSASIAGATSLVTASLLSVTGAATFQTLSVNADNGISITADLTTNVGDLDLDADANNVADGTDSLSISSGITLTSAGAMNLDATSGGIAGAGTLSLIASDGITVGDAFSSAGVLTIDADSDAGDNSGTFSLSFGATLSTSNQAISIVADDVSLAADLNAGTATISFTDSDQSGIGLGAASVTNGLNFSNTDLAQIQSSGVTLSTGGNFAINGLSQPSTIAGPFALVGNGVSSGAIFSGAGSTVEAFSVSVTGDVTVASDVTAASGDLSIAAGGDASVSAGSQLVGASAQSLVLSGSTVAVGSGGAGSETVTTSGGGSVSIASTVGDVTLGDNAIASDSGSITISAAGAIDEISDSNTTSLSTAGAVQLSAGGSIGQSAGANLAGSGALDVDAASVEAESTGIGGVHLRSPNDIVVSRLVTADGDVEFLSVGLLDVQGEVTAGGTGNVELRGATMNFGDAGDVTAGGTIDAVASNAGGLTVSNDAVFTTTQGSVGGALVNSTDPFAGTADTGSPLTDSNREAQITVVIADSQASNVDIQIDWQEGDPVGPVVSAAPGDDRTQIIQSTISSASGTTYIHNYENAPDPSNPSADINVTLSIIDVASGTISLISGGQSVFQASQFSDQVVVLEVAAAILPFFIAIPETDAPEAPPTPSAQVQQVAEPLRSFTAESAQILTSSLGTSQETDQRFYVLRIVSFGSEGEVKIVEQGQEYKLPDLEDPDSGVGFELSQLPELFERLPDDRYRIYVVEGQMERLVLDFIIRDGQPIEAQSIDDAGSSDVSDVQTTETDEPNGAEQASAAERLGTHPTLSAMGLLLVPSMFKLRDRDSRVSDSTRRSSERTVR